MRQPDALRPGDTIALISPASPFFRGKLPTEEVLASLRERLGLLGLHTVVAPHATDTYGYLAGRDEARAQDLMNAFADPSIRGILCMGGGYGTPRLLDLLDYELIARNPKVFVGYSDITALHLAIGQKARLVTFHGPMGFELARLHRPTDTTGRALPLSAVDPTADATASFTWEWFVRAVMDPGPLGELPSTAPWQQEPLRCVVPGVARGPLVGGNLSLLTDTLGTPYEIDTTDKIVLIEEVAEPPYRIDRMLTQLRLAGKLQSAAGFIIAEWTNCVPTNPSRPTLTLRQVLDDIVAPLGKPTVYGLAAGHGPGRLTLPLGVTVTVDGGSRTDVKPDSVGRVIVEQAGVGV